MDISPLTVESGYNSKKFFCSLSFIEFALRQDRFITVLHPSSNAVKLKNFKQEKLYL